MATTIEEIHGAIHVEGFPMFFDGEQTLLFPISDHGQTLALFVHLMEDGGYILFRIPHFLDLSRTPYFGRVTEKLLEWNYNIKLLKFGVHPANREAAVEINLPLEDSAPSPQQLQRCMVVLTSIALAVRHDLLTLMETGIYPDSEDEGFLNVLDHLLCDDDPDAGNTS